MVLEIVILMLLREMFFVLVVVSRWLVIGGMRGRKVVGCFFMMLRMRLGLNFGNRISCVFIDMVKVR